MIERNQSLRICVSRWIRLIHIESLLVPAQPLRLVRSIPLLKNECLSRSRINLGGCFVQLRHHSQNYYNNNKTLKEPPNQYLFMINPFISNHDTQFLFRKNYQVLQRPTQPSPSPQHSTSTQLQTLQRRNPFTSHSPFTQPLKPNNLNSPERPASTTKNFHNLSLSRYFPGKGGLLQEADGWRRELEKKERERAQIYGVQGLRYNAYLGTSRQRIQNTDYFQLTPRRQEIKSPPPALKNSLHNTNNDHFYVSPSQRPPLQKPKQKPRQEYFQDQIYEQPPNLNMSDPRKPERYQIDEIRQSKVKDMFESQFQDRFKQSMNYNSFYGMNQQELQQKYKNVYNSSKFSGSNFLRRTLSMESEVTRLDVVAPQAINLRGRVYYRVSL